MPYPSQQSLSRCITCQDVCTLRSIVTCGKMSTTMIWSASSKICCRHCYCYATKASSTTIRSRVSQPASAGKEADLVNCKLITACYQNSERDSCAMCSVSVISANKLSLPELPQLIKIKLLIHVFQNFYFLVPIARRIKCPFFTPPADAHDHPIWPSVRNELCFAGYTWNIRSRQTWTTKVMF